MKPTYRRSCGGNLLMFSDLTLGPFKVKQSPMRRSSLLIYFIY